MYIKWSYISFLQLYTPLDNMAKVKSSIVLWFNKPMHTDKGAYLKSLEATRRIHPYKAQSLKNKLYLHKYWSHFSEKQIIVQFNIHQVCKCSFLTTIEYRKFSVMNQVNLTWIDLKKVWNSVPMGFEISSTFELTWTQYKNTICNIIKILHLTTTFPTVQR